MAISITDPRIIVKPVEPVDPSWCPTCLSGLQPVDPPYEEAIHPRF